MASRALRILRRPLYSLVPRTLATPSPSPSSSLLSNSVKNSDVCRANNFGKENLHLLRVVSARSFTSNSGETASKAGVVVVSNADQYSNLLKEAKDSNKVAVVYFTAKWCGPCRHISPVFDSLSEDFKDVQFLKVDLDEPELQRTVDAAGITAVILCGLHLCATKCLVRQHFSSIQPTFQFHTGGKLVSSFSGADSKRLRTKVEELLEESGS